MRLLSKPIIAATLYSFFLVYVVAESGIRAPTPMSSPISTPFPTPFPPVATPSPSPGPILLR